MKVSTEERINNRVDGDKIELIVNAKSFAADIAVTIEIVKYIQFGIHEAPKKLRIQRLINLYCQSKSHQFQSSV